MDLINRRSFGWFLRCSQPRTAPRAFTYFLERHEYVEPDEGGLQEEDRKACGAITTALQDFQAQEGFIQFELAAHEQAYENGSELAHASCASVRAFEKANLPNDFPKSGMLTPSELT